MSYYIFIAPQRCFVSKTKFSKGVIAIKKLRKSSFSSSVEASWDWQTIFILLLISSSVCKSERICSAKLNWASVGFSIKVVILLKADKKSTNENWSNSNEWTATEFLHFNIFFSSIWIDSMISPLLSSIAIFFLFFFCDYNITGEHF